jgi:hypothetical protein
MLQVAGGLQSLQFVWAAENCPKSNSSSSSNRTSLTLLQPLPALTPKPIPAVPLPPNDLTQLVVSESPKVPDRSDSPKVPERAGPPPPAAAVGKTTIIRPIAGPADDSSGPVVDSSPVVPAPAPVVTVSSADPFSLLCLMCHLRGPAWRFCHTSSRFPTRADFCRRPTWLKRCSGLSTVLLSVAYPQRSPEVPPTSHQMVEVQVPAPAPQIVYQIPQGMSTTADRSRWLSVP